MIRLRKHAISLSIAVMALGLVINCKGSTDSKSIQSEEAKATVSNKPDIGGNYVSEGYRQKAEGYDWVAVSVKKIDLEKISIKVRSRADRKKPTCTFDATAYKNNENTYKTVVRGKTVVFEFSQDSLSIREAEEGAVLYFYCSGGATVAGDYAKIRGVIDATQVDKTNISQVLFLQDIGFNVSSIKKDGRNVLTVLPFGLEIDNSVQTTMIKGNVVEAMTEDMNSDGSPELLVITRSEEPSKKGYVYGYSVNNRKSMSPIHFPPTAENQQINQGYQGHDEFALVETTLMQRFPIFDAGGKATGETRQISYALKEGEALRRFEVQEVSIY